MQGASFEELLCFEGQTKSGSHNPSKNSPETAIQATTSKSKQFRIQWATPREKATNFQRHSQSQANRQRIPWGITIRPHVLQPGTNNGAKINQKEAHNPYNIFCTYQTPKGGPPGRADNEKRQLSQEAHDGAILNLNRPWISGTVRQPALIMSCVYNYVSTSQSYALEMGFAF